MTLNLTEREAVILSAMFSIGSAVVHADKETASSFIAKVRSMDTTSEEVNSVSRKIKDAAIRAGYAAREVRPGGIA